MRYESRDFKVASVISIYGLAPLSPPPASQILSFLKIGDLFFSPEFLPPGTVSGTNKFSINFLMSE